MSSFSIRLMSPSLPNSNRFKTKLSAAPPPNTVVVPPTPVAGEVDAGRLEPRVEEREGYWVLKEKFRGGINPQEKVKIEKEPMKLFMEDGIEELAKISLEEIEKSKITKDDIDVRLKWLGLFHRRKHQYGRFMMRLKLPNGVTTSAQTRFLASVIRQYGKEGCADVTTRQNWQIRGVVLPDVPEIMKGLTEVGLTSLQSGMDNVRNPVGNPLAGIDPFEIVDTRPYTNLLSQFITANSQGNPALTNLGTFLCLKMVVTRSKRGNDDDDDDFEVPPTVLQKKKVPKKGSKSSKESPSKLNIMHGVRERENYMKQYRSNIVSLINIMRDTRFTKRHITTLERTPFGMLFKCFWKKDDVELKNFKKVDDNVMDVIKCYDFHAKGFKLGGKICDIRDSDVTLIFGIKSGTKKVDVSYGKKQKSAFVQRRFRNLSRISVKSLREALGDALEGTTRVDIEDVARIMCLFVVATLLLPTTGLTVGWAFVALVEDLEMMNSYAWSTAVASTLTTSIHSSLGSPENVTGCVLLLLYWLCEHTTLIQPEGKNLCPRLLRWDLSRLRTKLMKRSLQTLKPEEVNHNELKPISKEEMELICNDDEEDALDIEQNLETEEDSLDTQEKLETEEDALDMEEKLETKEDEDDVAEILGYDQPLKNFIDLQNENKRLKSENLALVEELKKLREAMQKMKEEQKAKTKETMEKMSNTEKEMEKLRKEIEVLESENKQLVEQIEENAVHAATQGLSSKEMPHAKGVEQEENIGIQSTLEEIPIVVEPLQTSMVRKIKIKSRKKKEMSDFECEPREAKKKKTRKQGIEVMSKEVICVEDLPLSQAKPVERVSFPDKAAICKLLDEDDKYLLNKIYNLETTE